MKAFHLLWCTCILLLLSSGFAALGLPAANAQTHQEVTGIWSEPLNLSQSGAASQPRMVVDSDDVLHVIWREDVANSFFYTRRVSDGWQQPVALQLPFSRPDLTGESADTLFNPQLLADSAGRIHAFWRDARNALFVSNVLSTEIGTISSWSEPQQLSASVADFAVAVDGGSNIHLSFIRRFSATESTAGVYYMRWNSGDQIWSQAVPVDESSYYRAVDPDEEVIGIAVVNHNLPGISSTVVISESVTITGSLSTTGTGPTRVIITTENRLVEKLLAFVGDSAGDVWQEPVVVDERRNGDAESSVGPSSISVVSSGDEIHLTWIAGHQSNCEQYHVWSSDGAVNWETAVAVPSIQERCPDSYEMFSSESGLVFMLSRWDSQAYLQAWNGLSWSEPELQMVLADFVDPVVNRVVTLGCQQVGVSGEDRLIVVGCGTGDNNDVWIMERTLGNEATWFPSPEATVWSDPELLFGDSSVKVMAPVLLSGENDQLHSFWISSGLNQSEEGDSKIYYTQRNGDSWIRPVPLFHLDMAKADRLQGATYDGGCIFLMWRSQENNAYYFQQVDEANVMFPADWSSPRQMFELESVVDSPDIYMDTSGALGVVYARPLNEARGIYLMQVEVCGTELSEPKIIFDAVEAEWDMVGYPHMVQASNDDYHAVATRFQLRPEPVAIALYYFQSPDIGVTWSSPELIAAGDIRWSQIINASQNKLLITWQQAIDGQMVTLATQSVDGGNSWDSPSTLATSSTIEAQPVALVDGFDGAKFLQLALQGDELFLQERLWQGGNWSGTEEYFLAEVASGSLLADVSAVAESDGELALAYIIDSGPESLEAASSRQFVTTRESGIPTTASPVPSATEPVADLATAQTPPIVQQPPLTPSPTVQSEVIIASDLGVAQSSTSIIVVLVPAFLVVAAVVLIVVALRRLNT